MAEKYTEKLRVKKEIVSLLSRSTYQRSFTSAIREMVSNAYDADALSVNIGYDRDLTVIEIEDDGNGMTRQEFKKYLTLADSKKEQDYTRKYRRKRIGQFGVGFLSIFPFCELIEIETTTENSVEVLKARIPAKDYFNINTSAKKGKGKATESLLGTDGSYIDDIPVYVEINTMPQERLRHYTIIKLISPSHIVKQYFKKPDSKRGGSIQSYPPQKKLIWELEEDLPISLSEKSKYYNDYKYEESIGINVSVGDEELVRHDYLKSVLNEGTISFGDIKCKYIFTTNFESIKPEEARGIKLRVNNVGVGPRQDFLLRRSKGFPRLHFITGEVFFSEEIKPHLNLSRDGFISNEVTDEIMEYFAGLLRNAASEVQNIVEAENALTTAMSAKRSNATKSPAEIIDSNVKKLISRGFTLVENKDGGVKVSVDKIKKTISLSSKKAKVESEILSVLGRKIKISYDKWSIEDKEPAIKFIDQNRILVNQNFPLFKSKSKGNIFKRIYLLLLVGSKEVKTSLQLLELINKNILDEFIDLIK